MGEIVIFIYIDFLMGKRPGTMNIWDYEYLKHAQNCLESKNK